MAFREWTREEADELNRRLKGKTIERVEYYEGGIINIVTADCSRIDYAVRVGSRGGAEVSKCPNCGEYMQMSDFVIDTNPPTYESYCACGLIIDQTGDTRKVCSRSKGFNDNQIEELNKKLK